MQNTTSRVIGIILLLLAVNWPAAAQEQRPAVQQAPSFHFSGLNGESFDFPVQRADKPTLLYFWATWCPYCKKATPRVVKLHEQFSEQINVLAVNVGINDSVVKAQQYLRDYDIHFPVAFDHESRISQAYHVFGTPVFVIVSQSGQILYRGHRYPDGIEQALTN